MPMLRRLTSAVRRIVRDVADAPRVHRELQHHRAQAETGPVPAPLTAGDIKGEPPEVAEIETAARLYQQARQETNAAARLKRQAEKILKRTPDGAYGAVTVERYESSRQTADLDRIREIFAAKGLGDIPMRRCAPSITISWATEATIPADLAVLAA